MAGENIGGLRAELLDYFDSTYISGRLRQQNPAQNQAVYLVLTRNPPMFSPAIWNVHDATVNGEARTNNMCEGMKYIKS
jgi:hypothetical protein